MLDKWRVRGQGVPCVLGRAEAVTLLVDHGDPPACVGAAEHQTEQSRDLSSIPSAPVLPEAVQSALPDTKAGTLCFQEIPGYLTTVLSSLLLVTLSRNPSPFHSGFLLLQALVSRHRVYFPQPSLLRAAQVGSEHLM